MSYLDMAKAALARQQARKDTGSAPPTPQPEPLPAPGLPSPTRPDQPIASLLGLPLDRFAAEGQPLEVRVPWWPTPHFFVPTPRDVEALTRAGIGRERIWLPAELAELVDAGASVEDLRGRTLVRLVVRAFDGEVTEVSPRGRDAEAAPTRDLLVEYRAVLTRLYELAGLGPDADPAECGPLLALQRTLADALGPAFARAVDRQYSRVWAAQRQQCPSCGAPGVYHDLDTGETIPIDLDTIVRWTAHAPVTAHETPETGPSGLRDASGWLITLRHLGARRAGALAPCTECGAGTWCTYGDRPLCRPCADAWGAR